MQRLLFPWNFQLGLFRDLPLRSLVSCGLLQALSRLLTLNGKINTCISHSTATVLVTFGLWPRMTPKQQAWTRAVSPSVLPLHRLQEPFTAAAAGAPESRPNSTAQPGLTRGQEQPLRGPAAGLPTTPHHCCGHRRGCGGPAPTHPSTATRGEARQCAVSNPSPAVSPDADLLCGHDCATHALHGLSHLQ